MPRQPYTPFEDSVYRPVEHLWSTQGVAPDLPPERLAGDFQPTALNFWVRDGRVQKRDGYTPDTTPTGDSFTVSSAATALFEYNSPSNGATMVIAGAGGLHARLTGSTAAFSVLGSVSHDSSLDNPSFLTSMRTASSGFRVIHTNGVNSPAWWTGATGASFTTLTTALTGVTAIAWKSHLLLGNTNMPTGDGALGVRLHWSALGSPAIFAGTASAGNLDLTDANGSDILRFEPLRTVLAVYKEAAVHSIIYKASPLYFTQAILHPTIALVGKRALCPIENGERHFVFTREGAIIWDGQTVRGIGVNRVDRTLLNQVNWDYPHRCWAAWNPLHREVYLGLHGSSTSTVITRVWIYNLDYNSWWETDLSFIALQYFSYFYTTPRLVGALNDNATLMLPFSGVASDNGSSFSASIQTALFDYGAFENKGAMQLGATFSPGTGSSVTVALTKAAQANPLIASTFTSSQSLTNTGGAGLQKIDFRRSERWFAYRLTEGPSTDRLVIDRLIPSVTERTNARIDRA